MKLFLKPPQRVNLFVILLLFIAASVFEFLPAVKEARCAVPESVYTGKSCGCDCISNSRPWYGVFNYWKWFWILIVPLLVLFVESSASKYQKIMTGLGAIGVCYFFMNLAVHLHWDIRNGPFIGLDFSYTGGIECADIGDGANIVFTLFFGWIPAGLYTAFWFAMRYAISSINSRKPASPKH
jgi:hypothetical protein